MTFLQLDRSPGRERVENIQALGEDGDICSDKNKQAPDRFAGQLQEKWERKHECLKPTRKWIEVSCLL